MSEFRFPKLRGRGSKETAPRRGTSEVVRADLALSWLSEAWSARVSSDAGVAVGRALAGDRVSLWLREGAGGSLGTLGRAAATRVPLLAWTAVSDTAELPALVATGALVAVARSAQDLVDLSLELRWISERALLPAIVAYEPGSLGRSIQDLVVPDLAEVRRIFGTPDTRRTSADRTEEVLFGPTRTAVPAWFDFDRPLGTDGRGDGASGAAGRLAARLYLGSASPDSAGQPLSSLGLETAPVWVGGRTDAGVAVVVCGTLTEDLLGTAEAAEHRVVALRHLAPFPAEACARALEGARSISVWSAETGPSVFAAWVRDALRGHGSDKVDVTHATVGVGGLPLRPGDASEALARLAGAGRKRETSGLSSGTVIGWEFAPEEPARPHRDALHATLRRDHPDLAGLGLVGATGVPSEGAPSRQGGVATAGERKSAPGRALRILARPGLSYLDEAAGLLHGLLGGHVRSREIETAMGPRELLVVLPVNEPVDWIGWAGRPENADLLLPDDLASSLPGHAGAAGSTGSGSDPAEEPIWLHDARILGFVLAELAVRRPELAEVFAERPVRSLLGQRLRDFEPDERARRTEALVGAMTEFVSRSRARLLAASAGDGPDSAGAKPASIRTAIRALSSEPPAALGEVTGDGSIIDPARAWHQAVRPWEEDGPTSLVPEPGRIAGARPVLATAFLRSQPTASAPDALLPSFDLATCTGCAGCWSICPESAIQAHADTPARLFEQALDRAGNTAGPLRRGARQIGQTISRLVGDSESSSLDFTETLRAATLDWIEKSRPDEALRTQLNAALDAVCAGGAGSARGRNEVFWDSSPEKNRALLSLAVDPDACTSCGLCALVCEPDAIELTPRDDSRRQGWSQLQSLADTPGSIIQGVESALGVVPARLLSRYVTQSFAGRRDLPGSLGALSLRWIVSSLEAVHQPRVIELRQSLASLAERLGERIRGQMAASLPLGDLDALAAALTGAGKDADLEALAHGLRTAESTGRLDGSRLARIVETARGIHDLRWREDTGCLGAGRARFGLVASAGVDWVTRFPAHPAFAPLRAETSEDAVRVWAGLVAAHGERSGREAALRREAERLVTTRDADPAAPDQLTLSWAELTPEERRVVPPILLVAHEAELVPHLGEIAEVLRQGGPAGVLALSTGTEAAVGGGAVSEAAGGGVLSPWMLLGAAGASAAIVQSSPVRFGHLGASLVEFMENGQPFFLRLLAPEPTESSAPRSAYDRALREVESGRYPLFTYDPGRPFADAVTLDDHSLSQAPSHSGEAAWAELAPWIPAPEPEEEAGQPVVPSAATEADLARVRRETEAALVGRLTDRLAQMWKAQRRVPGASNGVPVPTGTGKQPE